jgi:hypothetical protein
MPSPKNDALLHYARRALGDAAPESLPAKKPKLSIVHAQAEVVKRNEKLRKLAANDSGDGGRKA